MASQMISFRITPPVADAITQLAASRGVTRSELLRDAICALIPPSEKLAA